MIICTAEVFSSAQETSMVTSTIQLHCDKRIYDSCTFHHNGALRSADNVKTSRFVPQISCLEAYYLFSTYWLRLPLLKCSFLHASLSSV